MLTICTLADRNPRRNEVITAIGALGEAVAIDSCFALLSALRRTVFHLLVIGTEDAIGTAVGGTITITRSEFPALPILAVCDLTRPSAESILPLARAGVDDVLVVDVTPRPQALRDALRRAMLHRNSTGALTELLPHVPADLRGFFTYCFEHAHERVSIDDAARAIAVHRATLAERLARASLPSGSTIIGWARCYHTARLLEVSSWSVEQIALACHFGSGAALSGFIHRHLGVRPTDVRELGGASYVLDTAMDAMVPGLERAHGRAVHPRASRSG